MKAFDFGRNWREFLDHVDVKEGARNMALSLRDFCGEENVRGHTFLDIGCGTGLAALELGASSVVAVDVSENSARCAEDVRALRPQSRPVDAPLRLGARRGLRRVAPRGYPDEHATHDEVVAMVQRRGPFERVRSRRDSGCGCNDFVFRRGG